MKLNLKIFVITTIFITEGTGYCSIMQENPVTYATNYATYNNFLHQKTTNLLYNNKYVKNLFNHVNNLDNTIISYPYHNENLPLLYNKNKCKIHLQNNSVHISHIFYNYKNKYQKILPFLQFGFENNVFSNKIISIGGGNRYVYNNLCAIGYNIFYHYPVSSSLYDPIIHDTNNINQIPHIINISGEYWYKNILFMLNSFYKIDNHFFVKKLLKKNEQYPENGYQIHICTRFPKYIEFIGKITLEQFFYKKMQKNPLNKNINPNYQLIIGIDYYPIPMLGFNINKVFTKMKKNNITYTICIDYQFNIPIIQQIYNTNNNQKPPSIFTHIHDTIHPFIPVIITPNIKNNNNSNINSYEKIEEDISKCSYIEITGCPGEIKIIENNEEIEEKNKIYNNKSIKWNIQSLQELHNYGGDIILLKNNIYAIQIPYQSIPKNNQLIVSYVMTNNDNITHSNLSDINKKIFISVQNFQKNNTTLLHPKLVRTNSSKTIKTENNINNNDQIYISQSNEHYSYEEDAKNKIPSAITSINSNSVVCKKNNNSTIQNSFTFLLNEKYDNSLLSPSLPCTISSVENNVSIKENNVTEKTTIKTLSSSIPIPPTFPISPLFLKNKKTLHQEKNYKETIPLLNTIYDNNAHSDLLSNKNLFYLLSAHKKSKFSSIGTIEHLNKLENTMTKHKNKKYLSDMEKIFSKIRLTQSTSSVDELYYTTDDSE